MKTFTPTEAKMEIIETILPLIAGLILAALGWGLILEGWKKLKDD